MLLLGTEDGQRRMRGMRKAVRRKSFTAKNLHSKE